jgi:hypothetical protein
MADVSSDAGASPNNADSANNHGRTASRLRAACNECHASKVLTSLLLLLQYDTSPCFAYHMSTVPTDTAITQPSHSVYVGTLRIRFGRGTADPRLA